MKRKPHISIHGNNITPEGLYRIKRLLISCDRAGFIAYLCQDLCQLPVPLIG
ncbi:hypothetical protein [Coleofasciculus sp. G2-EDA-02]|uniref:hypothetical protein n=1 Tax=Coleofasciculus sp. G2-EDA-02 TaxID=3069529 RepID=UPI0032F6949F